MAPSEKPQPSKPYDIPKEGSLGLLALGYRGLVAWRAVRGTDWLEERRKEYEEIKQKLEAKKAEEEAKGAEETKQEAEPAPPTISADVLEKLTITIVSGLPRSGTSMMMQMLTAGGLTAFTDGKREADESNPKGYYEHDRVKALAKDSSWLPEADGMAVKVVAPLLRYLPAGPAYRIVFMERDIEEILRSQSTMLARDGRTSADREVLRRAYERQVAEAKAWAARQKRSEFIAIAYQDVLADAAAATARVNSFLGGSLNESAMAEAVDPSLHREHS
ncbi:MAG: sulfotransferase domain-containing protein [Bacteroidetes bacterium]|nr:sulfotransferase domain-containing protein [Bacteroidota bacterium]